MIALITLSTFGCVTLLTGLVLYPILSRQFQVKDRIAKLMPEQEEELTLVPKQKTWQRNLAGIGEKLQMRAADMRIYRADITAAGFRKEAVYVFLGAKILLAVALPACYLILFALPRYVTLNSTSLLVAVTLAIAGYLVPTYWISRVAAERKKVIFHALPDVLDLLTVCVEAGLSLEAALVKTTDNFEDEGCPLVKEIKTVLLEMRAGRVRSEALKALAERTMVEDVRSLVALLIQTEKYGTSLGRTLRTYSDSLRMKRKQLAEERAAKTGIKMLFPLTFFIFPGILVVILVPAFIRIYGIFDK
ncbi:type II secretion system F family protein [Geomonas sp. RF6]|uniref:type II secretion system F family protein n=1 Tax=Geomonas sp. RF6 TaxID=2897342 RepID=UPI001E4F316B|nr:type II secretion system F family protein [Geomonas sp. RF6]UFS70007.1 type II secretion system F family protein [Geomonas sp. RF6]